MSRSVCIVGAGASGLITAKQMLDAGLEVTIFEAGSHVGGLWVYDNDNGCSIAYRNLHINSFKRITQLREFPMAAGPLDYVSRADMERYLNEYADYFGLRARIAFRRRVTAVRRSGDHRWSVTAAGAGAREFDAVVVATGHYSEPRWPELPGAFDGELLHSSQYREPARFAGRRVLVVGIGNSACDIAVDLSLAAARTVVSTRSGALVAPKYAFGRPLSTLVSRFEGVHVPRSWGRRAAALMIRATYGNLDAYGLRPPARGAHPTSNELFVPQVKYGRIAVRPGIAAVDGRHVHFEDGTSEPFDAIVAATGYRLAFPFLGDGLVRLDADRADVDGLYKRVVSVDQPGLYFVGLINSGFVPLTTLFQRQAEYAAAIEAGTVALPPREEMLADVRARRAHVEQRYLDRPRHHIEEHHIDYLVEVERELTRRRTGRASGAAGRRRHGRRCWCCGELIAAGEEREHHASDWGKLRWRLRRYTRPVRLCPSCFRAQRRADNPIRVAGSLVAAVVFVAANVALSSTARVLHREPPRIDGRALTAAPRRG